MRDGQDPGGPSSDALSPTSPGRVLKAWPLVALATALAFGLALHKLGHASFWGDELETWGWAHFAFDRIQEAATRRYHTPFYFWFMHGWVRLGAAPPDEFWLRLPSAFFFALTAPMAYGIGRNLGGTPRAGVYAAFLVATFPFLLHYGQEARSWAMVTFFAACGFAAVARLMCRWRDGEEAPRLFGAGLRDALRPAACGDFRSVGNALGDDGPWAAYIASSIVVMHLHNTLVLFPLVTGLILACAMWTTPRFRGVRFASLCIAMALIALGYLPQVAALLDGLDRIDLSYRIPTPSVESVFPKFAEVYGYAHRSAWGGFPLVVLVSLAVTALIIWARRREWHRVAFALSGWLGVPALLILFSFWKPILSSNTLIWSLPPFLAICAAGLAFVPSRFVRLGLLAGLLALNLEGVAREWDAVEENWREAAKIIARDASPGTAVLYCPVWRRVAVNHYLGRSGERPDIDAYGFRVSGDGRDVVFQRLPDREPAGFEPARLFPRYRRVYVVGFCVDPPAGRVLRAALPEWEKFAQRQEFPGVPLLRYERPE